MNNRNKIIHAQCSHYYCEYCVKTKAKVDTLDEACDLFTNFNEYEYSSNRKELKNKVI